MKRNSNNSKDTMDFIELSSDTTRFRKEDQYLKINPKCVLKVISSNHESASNYSFLLIFIILIKWMLCIYNHTICIWCLQWGNKQVCAKKRVFWLTPGGGNTISWNWLQEVDCLLFEWPPQSCPKCTKINGSSRQDGGRMLLFCNSRHSGRRFGIKWGRRVRRPSRRDLSAAIRPCYPLVLNGRLSISKDECISILTFGLLNEYYNSLCYY